MSYISSHLQAACNCYHPLSTPLDFFFFRQVLCWRALQDFRGVDYLSVTTRTVYSPCGNLKCWMPGHQITSLISRRLPSERGRNQNEQFVWIASHHDCVTDFTSSSQVSVCVCVYSVSVRINLSFILGREDTVACLKVGIYISVCVS